MWNQSLRISDPLYYFTDSLEVKEIYNFISHHFPFFDINEAAGWKNSLRHALSCQKKYFRSWENPIPSIPQDSRGKHSKIYSFRQEMRQKLIQSAQNACLLKEYQVKKAMINPEDLWNLIWKYKRILIVITYLLRILRIEILKRS